MDFRKSSYSTAQGGACIEVAGGSRVVMIRDSKQAHLSGRRTVLSVTPDAWAKFLDSVK